MMTRMMTGVAVAALLGASAAAAQSSGEKVVWGGGDPSTSTYSRVYVPLVIEALGQARLSGYEWGGPSAGTLENAQKVTDNPTHLALGQEDILRSLQGSPEYQFTILRDDLGPECLYLVTNNQGYENWGHVLGNAWDITLATGSERSGSFGTWQALTELYPSLQQVPVKHIGSSREIVDAVRAGEANFGFFVQRPDPANDPFETIAESNMTYVPVVDFEMESLGYEFNALPVTDASFSFSLSDFGIKSGQTVDTACTGIALITGDLNNVDPSDQRTLNRLEATIQRVPAQDTTLYRPDDSEFQSMMSNIVSSAPDRLNALKESARSTFDDLRDRVGGDNEG